MKIKSNKEVKMKYWIIASLALILIVAGVFGVNAYRIDASDTQTSIGCGSCNGGCTGDNNCGLSSCGAANGGECTCGKNASCNGSCSAISSCGSVGCGARTTGSCGCNK